MDRFTLPKLEHRVAEVGTMVYRRRVPVQPVRWLDGWTEEALGAGADDAGWTTVEKPHHWGGRDVKATIRARFHLPAEWRGEAVALRVELSRGLDVSGPDATAYIDGEARQGVDIYHHEILLPADLAPGEHVLALEAYSGTKPERHWFGGVELVSIDEEVRGYYYDAKVALDSARLLPEDSYDRAQIINAVDRSVLELDFHEPLGDAFRRSVVRARQVLRERLYGREWPGERPEVVGVGHAHIDVAWLWTLLHTRKKTARTFLTALRLMEQYPEYRFLQSEPQVYEFFREDFPEQYEDLKRRVAEGRWEPTGAMWLEADLNITGGESLVRQMLHGKRFLRQEFGIDSDILWLPDVFGYTWTLPQIMARSGVKYFMTTKISWNEFNRVPYDTFRWQGLDGTQVLSHFITTPSQSWFATYNGRLTAAEVKGTWGAYKQKRLHSTLLHAFGFGDGGGGPRRTCWRRRAPGRHAGPTTFRIGRADDSSALGEGSRRSTGLERRVVPGVPPGNLHLAGADQAPQPEERTGPARRRALAAMSLVQEATTPGSGCTGNGRRCCATSSTISCPAPPSARCTPSLRSSTGSDPRGDRREPRCPDGVAQRVATEAESVRVFNTWARQRQASPPSACLTTEASSVS